MNSEEFIDAIKLAVRDSAVTGTLSLLQKPPGRTPRQDLLEMSEWFNSLSNEDKSMLARVLRLNADGAVFGFLAVLDGERIIEDSPEKGEFELFYVGKKEKVRLNGPGQDMLHEIFNADE